jgi:hypothetical protein
MSAQLRGLCRRPEPEAQPLEPAEPGLGNLDRDFDAELDRRTLRRLCGLPQATNYEAAA